MMDIRRNWRANNFSEKQTTGGNGSVGDGERRGSEWTEWQVVLVSIDASLFPLKLRNVPEPSRPDRLGKQIPSYGSVTGMFVWCCLPLSNSSSSVVCLVPLSLFFCILERFFFLLFSPFFGLFILYSTPPFSSPPPFLLPPSPSVSLLCSSLLNAK